MLRGILKLLGFLLTVLVFFLPILACNTLRLRPASLFLLKSFYQIASFTWGITVQKRGELATERPLLMVSNHCSYIDVPVLGQLAPVRFTPKQDVKGWPLIGTLSKMAGCVFIDRSRGQTAQNRALLRESLAAGSVISLFPEGTTNDGSAPLPFKTSYFSLAEETIHGAPLAVQPVTVEYHHPDGRSLTRADMDKVAWFGDAEFVPHLWDYLRTQGVRATVTFHPAITMAQFSDRKAMAKYCEEMIAGRFLGD